MTRIRTLDGEPAGTLWEHDETDQVFRRATKGRYIRMAKRRADRDTALLLSEERGYDVGCR